MNHSRQRYTGPAHFIIDADSMARQDQAQQLAAHLAPGGGPVKVVSCKNKQCRAAGAGLVVRVEGRAIINGVEQLVIANDREVLIGHFEADVLTDELGISTVGTRLVGEPVRKLLADRAVEIKCACCGYSKPWHKPG